MQTSFISCKFEFLCTEIRRPSILTVSWWSNFTQHQVEREGEKTGVRHWILLCFVSSQFVLKIHLHFETGERRASIWKRTVRTEPQYDMILLLCPTSPPVVFHKEHWSLVTETPHYTNEIFTCLYSFQISSPITLWKTVKCNIYNNFMTEISQNR